MRVSKRRVKTENSPFGRGRAGVPARHFHSEAKDFAHFRQNEPQATAQDLKLRFLESRVNRVFLQILVQSLLTAAGCAKRQGTIQFQR